MNKTIVMTVPGLWTDWDTPGYNGTFAPNWDEMPTGAKNYKILFSPDSPQAPGRVGRGQSLWFLAEDAQSNTWATLEIEVSEDEGNVATKSHTESEIEAMDNVTELNQIATELEQRIANMRRLLRLANSKIMVLSVEYFMMFYGGEKGVRFATLEGAHTAVIHRMREEFSCEESEIFARESSHGTGRYYFNPVPGGTYVRHAHHAHAHVDGYTQDDVPVTYLRS